MCFNMVSSPPTLGLDQYRLQSILPLSPGKPQDQPYFNTLPAPANPAYLPIRLTVVAVSVNALKYGYSYCATLCRQDSNLQVAFISTGPH